MDFYWKKTQINLWKYNACYQILFAWSGVLK